MAFTGFTAKDFQVFAIPHFPGRMLAIRGRSNRSFRPGRGDRPEAQDNRRQ